MSEFRPKIGETENIGPEKSRGGLTPCETCLGCLSLFQGYEQSLLANNEGFVFHVTEIHLHHRED